jgi:pimeloyl-ACP methyl ester carboxylesterase
MHNNTEQTKVQNFELDKFIEVAGVKIRYRERMGEAPPILFLHGITESLEFWALQLEAGIGDHRLIALDLPGHGLSDDGEQPYDPDKFARFMVAFADALSIDRFYSVGNSLGGGIIIRLAGLLPGPRHGHCSRQFSIHRQERVLAVPVDDTAGYRGVAHQAGTWRRETTIERYRLRSGEHYPRPA